MNGKASTDLLCCLGGSSEKVIQNEGLLTGYNYIGLV